MILDDEEASQTQSLGSMYSVSKILYSIEKQQTNKQFKRYVYHVEFVLICLI